INFIMAINSKEKVLDYTTPLEITLKCLNLKELPKKNISSPFSEDKNPSFKIFGNGNFKCFSTGKHGDCFNLVAELNGLDCRNDFQKVLETIILLNNLNLTHNEPMNTIKIKDPSLRNKETKQEDEPFKINEVEKIKFESRHLDFWIQYGVNEKTLTENNVFAIRYYSFWSKSKNKEYRFEFTDSEVAFCYQIHNRYEIYIPEQKTKKKSFCNGMLSEDIFGLQNISSPVDIIIICAGKKDALTAISRGFKAVSFRSETMMPTPKQIKHLQSISKSLFICYDNDNGGENGKQKIMLEYPEIRGLQLPKQYKDLAEFFKDNSKEEFQKLIDISIQKKVENSSNNESSTTIFHRVEDYLRKNYDLRFNKISIEVEISKKNENQWSSCNENSLWLELQKKNYKIPINSLISILKSDFIPEFNPIKNYFENLPAWDQKTDPINKYLEYVLLEENESREQFEYHFKKWCVRAVKCALIDGYFNKQAFILTDDGKGQNIGKSSWCRYLCPESLSNYLAEDISDDKDARILLCKNFLINLDELAALSRKEINHLKSFFSKAQINERLPYDKKNSVIPRVASFIGSTNMSTFLQDETGSVRWLCFVVKNINWNYKTEFKIDDLWAQAYTLSKDASFDETLTSSDILQNEQRNDKFQIVSAEKDLILKHFNIPSKIDDAEFMSATEILHHLNIQTYGMRLSPVGVGKALKAIGYERKKQNQIYGYWVEKKSQ
ncbi:MAG: VapE domain-containing protein, partial [Flavobacterium sp.]